MIEKRVFTFNGSNEKLVGLKSIPDEIREKYKTVILAHGFGVDKENKGLFNDLTKSLVGAGFLVYRFDFSGSGESEGNYAKTSISKLSEDLKRIVQFVRSKSDTDLDNIGIVGNSMGSGVVLSLKPRVKSLVFIGGHYDIYSLISALFGDGFNSDGDSVRVNSRGNVIKMEKGFWSDLKENHFNLLGNVSELNCPVLFVHGDCDENIPFSQCEDLFDNANEQKKLVKISKANHNFTEHRDELCEKVVSWFERFLN